MVLWRMFHCKNLQGSLDGGKGKKCRTFGIEQNKKWYLGPKWAWTVFTFLNGSHLGAVCP